MNYKEGHEPTKQNKENYIGELWELVEKRNNEAIAHRDTYIKDIFKNPEKYREDFKKMLGWPLIDYEKSGIPKAESEKITEDAILQDEINCDTVISEEEAEEIIEAKSEEIQNALDNIYATEVKLETILEAEPEKEIDKETGIISSETVKKALLNEEKYTEADFEIDHFSTTYVKQTLRSGQIVNYDGNVVIIGDCHPGSEVIASGDITVWGILSGIAHAGAKGNPRAKVRALKMNAIQLRIANHYARKPDGMNTIFPERTSTFTPEEARVINNEIVIFKIND